MMKKRFEQLYNIIRRLRAPDGCPWDREQNPSTLRGSLIEETYECIEAIDEGDSSHVQEELGDLFLLAVMISYMYEEEGAFSVSDVLEGVSEKLIRRHPHVFGAVKVKDSEEVLDNWVKIKVEQEGRKPKDSLLDEVSRALPPLDRACKLQKKAAKAGFDWDNATEVFAKIDEELAEVKAALAEGEGAGGAAPSSNLEGELGDLLFSSVNLCRFLKVDPSVALQRTNIKFCERFRHVEKSMKERGLELTHENLPAMDGFWNAAKEGVRE
ncbi:MAG: nucleoside triphosphate pyrophosphohydrolase [Spirochaetaceae bacterium]|jgi:tetrapyrrole methylase family protein/MazG family protein|nr:nucleoside triphosphate pyrophosphohydrolase [Spirochaetaceae bacterium]